MIKFKNTQKYIKLKDGGDLDKLTILSQPGELIENFDSKYKYFITPDSKYYAISKKTDKIIDISDNELAKQRLDMFATKKNPKVVKDEDDEEYTTYDYDYKWNDEVTARLKAEPANAKYFIKPDKPKENVVEKVTEEPTKKSKAEKDKVSTRKTVKKETDVTKTLNPPKTEKTIVTPKIEKSKQESQSQQVKKLLPGIYSKSDITPEILSDFNVRHRQNIYKRGYNKYANLVPREELEHVIADSAMDPYEKKAILKKQLLLSEGKTKSFLMRNTIGDKDWLNKFKQAQDKSYQKYKDFIKFYNKATGDSYYPIEEWKMRGGKEEGNNISVTNMKRGGLVFKTEDKLNQGSKPMEFVKQKTNRDHTLDGFKLVNSKLVADKSSSIKGYLKPLESTEGLKQYGENLYSKMKRGGMLKLVIKTQN